MGKQAKLKRLRKISKCEDQLMLRELGESLHIVEEDLRLCGVPPTRDNLKAVIEYVRLIERPKNITDSEFATFLKENILDFIKNNLR